MLKYQTYNTQKTPKTYTNTIFFKSYKIKALKVLCSVTSFQETHPRKGAAQGDFPCFIIIQEFSSAITFFYCLAVV